MKLKKMNDEIWYTLQLIDTDINEINIGKEMLCEELPLELDFDGLEQMDINKMGKIPEGIRQRLKLMKEQINILEEQIGQLKKIQILNALKD